MSALRVELQALELAGEPYHAEELSDRPVFVVKLLLNVDSEDGAEQEEAARRACTNLWEALEGHTDNWGEGR